MKLVSLAMLLAAASSAAAFAPTPFGVSKVSSRPSSTKSYLVPDPEFLHHLAQHAETAVRVTILECDNTDCAQAQGWKEPDGWHFSGGLEQADHKATTKRILMMAMDDVE